MLQPVIEDNKLNTLIEDEVGNSREYFCLILLKFQLFLRIIIL
jgi:hypothetical protein